MTLVKIDSLSVLSIKNQLRSRGLGASGGRAALVLRLTEAVGGAEIEVDEVDDSEMSEMQQSIAKLTAIVERLSADVRILSENQRPAQTSTPGAASNLSAGERTDCRSMFHNARDVIDLLPDFDPRKTSSLSASAFVHRVRKLMCAYGWDGTVVIFAIQAKLKGPAKLWLDSNSDVFVDFEQFAIEFLRTFPDNDDESDVHLRMAADVRKISEPILEYHFRMCAEAKRGGLSERSIVRYICRGLNYSTLQNSIASLNFLDTNELYMSISRFLANVNKPPEVKLVKPPPPPIVPSAPQQTVEGQKRIKPTKGLCYNCFKPGHISINCPNPQRRARCSKCQKVGHSVDNCPTRRDGQINKVDAVPSSHQSDRVIKRVLLNNKHIDALIDPGSSRSLIRESDSSGVIECAPITLEGFGGGTYACTRKMRTQLKVDSCTLPAELLVVENELIPSPILLGTDVLIHDSRRVILQSGMCLIEDIREPIVTVKSELMESESFKFGQLLAKYRSCFADKTSEMGRSKSSMMTIQLTSEKPIQSRPYRIPFAKRAAVDSIIDELLTHNIIRPSESTYSSPIVLVEKQNGEDRLCVDFRAVNTVTQKTPFPMPIIDEILSQIAGNKFYTTLDLFSGYYQITLDENSMRYTAFVTHSGHYEYTVMPFGLVNAPMVFQQMITSIIRKLRSKKIVSYMDEVIIASDTIAEGIELLTEFLTVLEEEGLTLRTSKCIFFATEVLFLGHTISCSGIKPGNVKINAVVNFPTPTNAREVKGFLGLSGFFRKFIREYAIIARPLTALLKTKNQPKFDWTQDCDTAFEKLKTLLSAEPILALYDPSEFHQVHTDASSVGLAAVLFQSPDQVMWKPVFYYSRQCNEAEQRYSSHELEVLAIVEALERFKFYLLGKRFQVITDCQAVSTTKLLTPLNNRIARWWLKLQEFDFEVTHRAGNRMSPVDALSRSPTDEPVEPKSVAENMLVIGTNEDDWLLSMQKRDNQLNDIINILRDLKTSLQAKQIKKDYVIKGGRLMRNCEDGPKFVVPAAIRWRIVRSCHDESGHPGCEGTTQRIQKLFWFPRIRRYVKSYVSACIDCCLNKIPAGKREGRMFIEEVVPIPFRVLHVDYLGPFPRSKRGNVHIIALVDPFTKYTILRAVRDTSVKHVIAMLRDVTTFFGLPTRIISDRGSAYTSKEFSEFCSLHDIQHVQVPVRTPRANGEVERINHTVLTKLRCSTIDRNDWDQHLLMIQWTLNSQPHSTTGFTPNQLLFDFQLRDVTANRVVLALNVDDETASTSEIRQIAADRILHEKQRWKQRFDDKHKQPLQYQEGDLVAVDNAPTACGDSLKLEPKYKGPFQITKVLRHDRYVVEDLPDMRNRGRKYGAVYTADRLKPWCHLGQEIDCINAEDDNDNRDDYGSEVAELSTPADLATPTSPESVDRLKVSGTE